MSALSVSSDFQSATVRESEGEGGRAGESGATQISPWKYKKGRNGLKGRTPKHPMNRKAYTC